MASRNLTRILVTRSTSVSSIPRSVRASRSAWPTCGAIWTLDCPAHGAGCVAFGDMATRSEAVSITPEAELPQEFQPRMLQRRTLQAIALLGLLVAVVLLAPGLGQVRDLLVKAKPGWLVLATALEALSYGSYVLMFGPVFCTGLSRRRSWQIGGAELAMGSLVPASGAGGLALGAWILYRGGMDGRRIARRSVAFFLIKSGANFLAVAVIGAALAVGLLGPDLS